MLRDEWLTEDRRYWLDNFKRLRDDKMDLEDENKQLKERISNLVNTNTKLQNDLFSEQLEQDETEDYINKLKQEIVHLKECNLRYRNHNELLESIIGIRNNVIE